MRRKDQMSCCEPSDSRAVRWHHWHVVTGSLSLSRSYLSSHPPTLSPASITLRLPDFHYVCAVRNSGWLSRSDTSLMLISGCGRSSLLQGCQRSGNAVSAKLRNSDQHVHSRDSRCGAQQRLNRALRHASMCIMHVLHTLHVWRWPQMSNFVVWTYAQYCISKDHKWRIANPKILILPSFYSLVW